MTTTPTDDARLLKPTEAAELLGVSPSTLNFWRTRRRGPAYLKLASKVRYRLADLQAWLAANRRETLDSRAIAGAATR